MKRPTDDTIRELIRAVDRLAAILEQLNPTVQQALREARAIQVAGQRERADDQKPAWR